jgi:hypothetical protein
MEFEWNPAKARANKAKQGVSFAEAIEVFPDDCSSVVPDPDHSIGEERFVIFGRSRRQRYLVVAFTGRGDRIRIISARPMTRREQSAYEQ